MLVSHPTTRWEMSTTSLETSCPVVMAFMEPEWCWPNGGMFLNIPVITEVMYVCDIDVLHTALCVLLPYTCIFTFQTNRFQGFLITNGSASFAVFIYECGGMEWSGGVIGWQASTSQYDSHYLSGHYDNDRIGCLYSSTSSAIAFKVSDRKHLQS